jgi:endogenous inhibitor of DNA gyrase (YacG/DUF329 family)
MPARPAGEDYISPMPSNDAPSKSAPRIQRCPICGRPAEPEFRAFCSRRCADVDLNRWLSGVYVVPGKVEEDEDGGEGE